VTHCLDSKSATTPDLDEGTQLGERDGTMRATIGVTVTIALLALALAAGCTGKTEGGPSSGEDGGSGSSSGGGSGGSSGSSGGCVDVPLSSFDTSCTQSSDCTLATTGQICPGNCLCGGSAINVASQGAWERAVAGIPVGECGCFEPPPQCVNGVCTICTGTSNDPAGCNSGAPEAGTIADATVPACVYISPSTYTTSCNASTDCTRLPSGQICSGECDCGGMPVNVSGQAAFEQATMGIELGACPCPAPEPVGCVDGTCTGCEYLVDGGTTCGDGG
jgi:hypothetical protein